MVKIISQYYFLELLIWKFQAFTQLKYNESLFTLKITSKYVSVLPVLYHPLQTFPLGWGLGGKWSWKSLMQILEFCISLINKL